MIRITESKSGLVVLTFLRIKFLTIRKIPDDTNPDKTGETNQEATERWADHLWGTSAHTHPYFGNVNPQKQKKRNSHNN